MIINNKDYLDRFISPIADIESIKYDLSKENLNQETRIALSLLLGESLKHLEAAKLVNNDIGTPLSLSAQKRLFDSLSNIQ